MKKIYRNYSIILREHSIAYVHSILQLNYKHKIETIKATRLNCNFQSM